MGRSLHMHSKWSALGDTVDGGRLLRSMQTADWLQDFHGALDKALQDGSGWSETLGREGGGGGDSKTTLNENI